MHIHIPDGVLPIWLWGAGFLIAFVLLIIFLPRIKKDYKKMPQAGMLTALALLAMSLPLGLPIHINLLVLIGILMGPSWSLLVALLLNSILASFGHGGLTIVGLNTVILWLQALCGIFFFKLFVKFFKNYFAAASLSAFLSLFISFLLLMGVVAASKVEPAEFLHLHEEIGEKEIGHTEISLRTFIVLNLPIVFLGILIESLVTGFIVQFIKKVKPELIP